MVSQLGANFIPLNILSVWDISLSLGSFQALSSRTHRKNGVISNKAGGVRVHLRELVEKYAKWASLGSQLQGFCRDLEDGLCAFAVCFCHLAFFLLALQLGVPQEYQDPGSHKNKLQEASFLARSGRKKRSHGYQERCFKSPKETSFVENTLETQHALSSTHRFKLGFVYSSQGKEL